MHILKHNTLRSNFKTIYCIRPRIEFEAREETFVQYSTSKKSKYVSNNRASQKSVNKSDYSKMSSTRFFGFNFENTQRQPRLLRLVAELCTDLSWV